MMEEKKEDDNIISLKLHEEIKQEEIVSSFELNKKTHCIIAVLNHKYKPKTIVSTVYKDWISTIKVFCDQATSKGVDKKHLLMLTDVLDNSSQTIINECFFPSNASKKENDCYGAGDDSSDSIGKNDKEAIALELIKPQIAELFLDEVKTPYAAIMVVDKQGEDTHEYVETMPIGSRRFKEFVGFTYYNRKKAEGKDVSILSNEGIEKVQSVLRFELHKTENIKTLHLRVASFVDTETTDLDSNVVYYDLCNPNWDIIKATRHRWDIIKHNAQNIMFKRFPINS